MRYRDTGEVHKDFHRGLNGTIAYLRKHHGEAFLDDLFRRMGRDVYRSIHEDLKRGDPRQLVEHWTWYFDREGGEYTLTRTADETRFEVTRCPAVAYLEEHGLEIDPAFCRQTVGVNEALAEGTPFEIVTEVLGGGRCAQTLRRRPREGEGP